jgi:hypothetical protein
MSEPAPAGTLEVLKRDGRRGVYLVDVDGERIVVKRWPLTVFEAIKLCLGITQAQRQDRGARRLLAAGVRTPEPIGGVHRVRGGVRGRARYLETRHRYAEGRSLLDALVAASAEEKARLGAEMGEIVRRLGAARLFHRDAKLSNFVVAPDGAIIALDPVGVRRSRDRRTESERLRRSLLCELTPQQAAEASAFIEAALGAAERR